MAQKDVGNKVPIYKLKKTDEVMKYYDEWGKNNKYDQDMVDWNYTGPKETSEVFINWDKEFIGKESAQKENSSNKLIPLIVETNDIDVTNNEAVMNGDQSIGYVTSGGFAHFVNKSVAFTFVDQKNINSENKIQVEINGDLFNCSIIKEPLYDPSGQKMRS